MKFAARPTRFQCVTMSYQCYRLSRALWEGVEDWIRLIINQEEANAVNVENSGLWCPALAGEGPQDCWQNNNCQENGHGRETDEKVIVPEQIALPRVFSIVFVIPSCSSIVQAKKKAPVPSRLRWPTQLFTKGQWWSYRSTSAFLCIPPK